MCLVSYVEMRPSISLDGDDAKIMGGEAGFSASARFEHHAASRSRRTDGRMRVPRKRVASLCTYYVDVLNRD